jgi:hypothetical protein
MKKEKISIFKESKIKGAPTDAEAEENALRAIQVYLYIIKDDEEKINDFSDLMDDLIGDVKIKQKNKS